MSLTISKAKTDTSGGTISISKTEPDYMVNPCPVVFEVDISSASFDCSETYSVWEDHTFSNYYEPHRLELDAFWSFGDSGHWTNVTDEIPAEYSIKDRGLGIWTAHVFTDAAMTSAGTDYTVRVKVVERSSGKVAEASTTVTVKNRFFEADTIVLVNLDGDTDYSAFDATETALDSAGWTGTIVKTPQLGSGETFTRTSTLYSTYASSANTLWLFKGNGEAGSPVYKIALNVQSTDAAGMVFGSYGSGKVKVDNSEGAAILSLTGTTTRSFRKMDLEVVGGFDPAVDLVTDAGQLPAKVGYTNSMASGWWFIDYNVDYKNQGPGDGVWQMPANSAKATLCQTNLLDCGTEYALLAGGSTVEVHTIGCRMLDAPNRLVNANRLYYYDLSGGDFTAANTVTSSGGSATILSVHPLTSTEGTLIVGAITGSYSSTEAITDGTASAKVGSRIAYNDPTRNGLDAGTITGGTSGAEADVWYAPGTSGEAGNLFIGDITGGPFTVGETITDGSANTAEYLGIIAAEAPADVHNSHLRFSNTGKMLVKSSRLFMMRAAGGQYCFKLGNGNNDGSIGEYHLNVLEASGSSVGFNPVGGDFSELTSGNMRANICIFTPYTQGMADMNADGIKLEGNLGWVPAWTNTSLSQGDNTVCPRWHASVGGESPTGVWVGAPFYFVGNTVGDYLTSDQRGTNNSKAMGNKFYPFLQGSHPYPPEGTAASNGYVVPGNVTYTPNMPTGSSQHTYAEPLDGEADSEDGPRTQSGTLIAPKWGGINLNGVYDEGLATTHNELPSFRLKTGSSELNASGSSYGPLIDFLCRPVGPKPSAGAAQDFGDTYVAGWPFADIA
jgi:hypothetical protein